MLQSNPSQQIQIINVQQQQQQQQLQQKIEPQIQQQQQQQVQQQQQLQQQSSFLQMQFPLQGNFVLQKQVINQGKKGLVKNTSEIIQDYKVSNSQALLNQLQVYPEIQEDQKQLKNNSQYGNFSKVKLNKSQSESKFYNMGSGENFWPGKNQLKLKIIDKVQEGINRINLEIDELNQKNITNAKKTRVNQKVNLQILQAKAKQFIKQENDKFNKEMEIQDQLNTYINQFFLDNKDLQRNKIPARHFELLRKYYFKYVLNIPTEENEQENSVTQNVNFNNSIIQQTQTQIQAGATQKQYNLPASMVDQYLIKQQNLNKKKNRSKSLYDKKFIVNTEPNEDVNENQKEEWKMPVLIPKSKDQKEHLTRIYNKEGTPLIKYKLPATFQTKLTVTKLNQMKKSQSLSQNIFNPNQEFQTTKFSQINNESAQNFSDFQKTALNFANNIQNKNDIHSQINKKTTLNNIMVLKQNSNNNNNNTITQNNFVQANKHFVNPKIVIKPNLSNGGVIYNKNFKRWVEIDSNKILYDVKTPLSNVQQQAYNQKM